MAARGSKSGGERYVKNRARVEEAFTIYCELGQQRSIDRVQQILNAQDPPRGGPSRQTIGYWCNEFGWVRRAADYDSEKARREREAMMNAEVADAMERRTDRLTMARLKRAMVYEVLVPDGKTPINLRTIDPAQLRALDAFLTSAEDTERRDQAEILLRAASEQAQPIAGGGGGELSVLGPEALGEMRQMWGQIVAQTQQRTSTRRRLMDGDATELPARPDVIDHVPQAQKPQGSSRRRVKLVDSDESRVG